MEAEVSEIKRWTLKGTGACLLGDKSGEWCYYAHHAAELSRAEAQIAALREALSNVDEWFETLQGTDTNDPLWMMRKMAHERPRRVIAAALAQPAKEEKG